MPCFMELCPACLFESDVPVFCNMSVLTFNTVVNFSGSSNISSGGA